MAAPNTSLAADRIWGLREELLPVVRSMIASGVSGASAAAPSNGTSGGKTIVPLHGLITPHGSILDLLFGGGGGLSSFRRRLAQAVADNETDTVVLDIDSPGGRIPLVQEAAADIRAAREQKRVVAVANTQALSAAYWLASQADELYVTPSGEVGSVGVYLLHEDFSEMDKKAGVKTTLIHAGKYKTEGNALEPLTATARRELQRHVDAVYERFVTDIAAGRRTSKKAVKEDYGEGRVLLSDVALKAGMVDGVATFEEVLGGGPAPAEGGDDSGNANLSGASVTIHWMPTLAEAPEAPETETPETPVPDPEETDEPETDEPEEPGEPEPEPESEPESNNDPTVPVGDTRLDVAELLL